MSAVQDAAGDRLLYGGRSVILHDGLTIGSAPTASLQIDRRGVAGVQATLHHDDGGWSIHNQGPEALLVSGQSVPPQTNRALSDGDIVVVGDRAVTLRFGGAVAGAAPDSDYVDGFLIGRDRGCDLTLEDSDVSRHHVRLAAVDGGTLVEDLGSTNGTYVAGKRLTAPVTLGDGAKLQVGPFTLEVTAGLAQRARSAAPTVEARSVAVDAGPKRILHPTSVRIAPGELVAVIGGSGAGKSTLVRALAGVRPPSEGAVLLDDVSVERRRHDIGYVPQADIVHGDLTVREALSYSADLRLGDDSAVDRRRAVERAISEVELDTHAGTRIARLSGGQRKRASVAVELLGQPGVLVLDEPTTGLDPALDGRMMRLFRRLADSGRTVIVVTHATRMLSLCDRVLLMAPGGVLAYDGTPAGALEAFEVEHADELYAAVDQPTPQRPKASTASPPTRASSNGAERDRRAAPLHRQARILMARTLKLLVRDRRNLLILAGQVPVIGILIALLFESDVLRRPGGHPADAAQAVFLLVTAAVWFGAIDSAREIVKERAILARETATGLNRVAYLLAKLGVVGTVAALQTVLVLVIVLALRPFDEPSSTLISLAAVLAATAVTGVAMGLLISAVTRTQDQATSLIPLAMIPQLLFAGAIVPDDRMPAAARALTDLAFANAGYAGAGTSVHLGQRLAEDAELARIEPFGTTFFTLATGETLLQLGACIAIFAAVALVGMRTMHD